MGRWEDMLIPSPAEIQLTYASGYESWSRSVAEAEALPPDSWPTGCGDPCIMLKDVPALPQNLSVSRALVGQPVWKLRLPEEELTAKGTDDDWEPGQLFGAQKQVWLFPEAPPESRISAEPSFFHYGIGTSESGHSAAPRGLAILTLCWSYILSARFLELQGRQLLYAPHGLKPETTKAFRPDPSQAVVKLVKPASRSLVRWLCAILAPKPGWLTPDSKGYPAWAAFCSGNAQFVILTDVPFAFEPDDHPPSAAQATELLIEFCSLFGLCAPKRKEKTSEPMGPYTAAFFPALAIPFYRYADLKPQFPFPVLRRRSVAREMFAPIRQYTEDLRYYMTLSAHPPSVGSIVWSIF